MRKKILSTLLIFLFLVSGVYASETDDILGVLSEFHQTAMNEDLDGYIATQDTLYLDLITEDGLSYRDYFAAAFELTDILESTLSIQEVEIEGDKALVFYSVKGSARITETGDVKDIHNDMVAFLWHYPDGWKIRWTILQTLYQYKIESEILSSVAAELTLSELDDTTLRDEMISQGVISEEDLFNQAEYAQTQEFPLTQTSENIESSNDGKSDVNGKSRGGIIKVLLLLLFGGIVLIIVLKKRK